MSERATFHCAGVGVLITIPNYVVPYEDFEDYCTENDIGVGTYVIEPHLNGQGHTHMVFLVTNRRLFEVEDFKQKFGRYPNMRKLRSIHDAYRAMAYCCKHKPCEVKCSPGYVRHTQYEQILGHVWQYANNARGAKKKQLLEQYKSMQEQWYPKGGQQDRYNPIVPEDPDMFFN